MEWGISLKFIANEVDDVYYNLAMEEYILQNFRDGTYLLLWRNNQSIVVGKYQNVFEEVNLRAVEEAGIKVARRNSGGGTVYHDMGNLNYSIIMDYNPQSFIRYDDFLEPVISALRKMGIPAMKKGASDIAIDGMKISGSAQTIKRGRLLHHGTLLFDADLGALRELLRPTTGMITSRAVKSVRSPVANIRENVMCRDFVFSDFRKNLLTYLMHTEIEHETLTAEQIDDVRLLVEEKYSSWEWNFGKSPAFDFEKEDTVFGDLIKVRLRVEDGIITSCATQGCHISDKALERVLKDTRYSYREVSERLRGSEYGKGLTSLGLSCLTSCFF